MPARSERWFVGIILIGVLCLTTLPYLYANSAGGADYSFGGFLLNPLDGNTYLAKMQLGWRGEWRFNLLYTAENREGFYLFTFYILLGHLARWSGFSLVFTFHLARVMTTVWMVWILYRFLAALFPTGRYLRYALVLAIFGSGLGWLALPFGGFTADFWVAEAFPFLSAFANPHFPLALGLMAYLLISAVPTNDNPSRTGVPGVFGIVFSAVVLASVAPFGVVIAGLALVILASVRNGALRRGYLIRLFWLGLPAAPVMLYTLWVTRTDPLLSAWNAQNITPSPPWWNLVLAFSPVLLLALANYRRWLVDRSHPILIAGVWMVIAIILLYIPWSLQRRFALGFYLPLCVLAVDFLASQPAGQRWMRAITAGVLILALPTNLVIILAAHQAVVNRDDKIFLRQSEVQALEWIDENASPQAVVLASPDMGLYIPAHTGRRVVYGHPFETVDAQKQEQSVLDFYGGSMDASGDSAFDRSDYIVYGPREQVIGSPPQIRDLEIVFQNSEVIVYYHPHQ